MVRAAALILLAFASWTTSEGEFSIVEGTVRQRAQSPYPNGFEFWISNEGKALYRVHLNCEGRFAISATTKFDATGKPIEDWDSAMLAWKAIRPGTMYEGMEGALCRGS